MSLVVRALGQSLRHCFWPPPHAPLPVAETRVRFRVQGRQRPLSGLWCGPCMHLISDDVHLSRIEPGLVLVCRI